MRILKMTNSGFVSGTLVHTQTGLKPIEQIQVGDFVLSKPESGQGEQAYKRVVNTFKHEDKEVMLVEIQAPDKLVRDAGSPPLSAWPAELREFLVTTLNHPFWIPGVGWTAARMLYPHDPVMSQLEFASGEIAGLSEAGPLYQTPLAPGKVWFIDPDMHELGVIPVDYRYGEIQANTWDGFEPSPDINMGEAGRGYKGALRQTVYNIEVEDWHTYYVGKHGVLVHDAIQ
jgi:hypothetical protein